MLRKKTLNLASALMLAAGMTLSVAACTEPEGPAEQAGEELDQTLDNAQDAAPAQQPAPSAP